MTVTHSPATPSLLHRYSQIAVEMVCSSDLAILSLGQACVVEVLVAWVLGAAMDSSHLLVLPLARDSIRLGLGLARVHLSLVVARTRGVEADPLVDRNLTLMTSRRRVR